MGMRSMKRRLARHMMELNGIEQINKKKFEPRSTKEGHDVEAMPGPGKKASYFANHWRDYLDPESAERKALHAKLLRDAAREKRKDPKKPVLRPWPCGYGFVGVGKR